MTNAERLLERCMELLAQWNNSQGVQEEDAEFFADAQRSGYPAPDWFRDALEDASSPKEKVVAFWNSWGFTEISTGGNCKAFVWEDPAPMRRIQILVTAYNEAWLPRSLDERVAVGVYCMDTGESLLEHAQAKDFPDSESALSYALGVKGIDVT